MALAAAVEWAWVTPGQLALTVVVRAAQAQEIKGTTAVQETVLETALVAAAVERLRSAQTPRLDISAALVAQDQVLA